MLKKFDYSDVLKSVIKRDLIATEYKRNIERIKDANDRVNLYNQEIEQIRKKICELKALRYGSISGLLNYFNIGPLKKIKKRIKALSDEIVTINFINSELLNEIEDCKQELKIMQQQLPLLRKAFPYFLMEKDGSLLVTDFVGQNNTGINNISSKTNLSYDKKVLVHMSNFFPKNNIILSEFDRKKIVNEDTIYRKINRQVEYISHRHTVHFTLNGCISYTNDVDFIIIDEYNSIFGKTHANPCDIWTSFSSYGLSDNAVILVNYGYKDKLSDLKEDLSKYKIVFFDGNPKVCLNNFLKFNRYPILNLNDDFSNYNCSMLYELEKSLNLRDLAISFFSENICYNVCKLEFNLEQIIHIIDFSMQSFINKPFDAEIIKAIFEDKISECNTIENIISMFNFIICSGIYKKPDGMFAFKSDEEIFEEINNIETLILNKDYFRLKRNIDFKFMFELCDNCTELSILYENATEEQIERNIDDVFKNLKANTKEKKLERSKKNGKM